MKFIGAMLAYLFMAVVLGWGILLAASKGSFWLLGFGTVAYLVALTKLGCLPASDSH